jgi:hypothetical protein
MRLRRLSHHRPFRPPSGQRHGLNENDLVRFTQAEDHLQELLHNRSIAVARYLLLSALSDLVNQ